MNVNLKYSLDFVAGSWFEQELLMCNYTIDLHLLTQSMDPADQNIAIERVRWFVENQLHSSIIVNQAEADRAEVFYDVGFNVCTLPEEPVDQVLGIVLHSKLNAIMEGRIVIKTLSIKSDTGGIEYIHNDNEITELLGDSGWWFEPTPRCHDIESDEQDKEPEWKDVELAWANEQVIKDLDTAIFVNITPNETKH